MRLINTNHNHQSLSETKENPTDQLKRKQALACYYVIKQTKTNENHTLSTNAKSKLAQQTLIDSSIKVSVFLKYPGGGKEKQRDMFNERVSVFD